MDKKFSGNQWFTVNNNTKPVYEDPVEQNNNVAFNKQPIEELNEDPEALEGRFLSMLEDRKDPDSDVTALDLRDAYVDCINANIHPDILADHLDKAIEEDPDSLHPHEAYFILTGTNPGEEDNFDIKNVMGSKPRMGKAQPEPVNYDKQWDVSGYYKDNDGRDIRDRD